MEKAQMYIQLNQVWYNFVTNIKSQEKLFFFICNK